MVPVKNLYVCVAMLIGLLLFGTGGYWTIEGWPLLDALYMTVITVTTVGFREVMILSPAGRLLTIVLIIVGVGFITYSAGSIVQFMVEGQLRSIPGRKKVEKKISSLRGHYIICGYGRIGTHICRELEAKPIPFVVVEHEPGKCQRLYDDGILHARGLVTAVTSGAGDTLMTLGEPASIARLEKMASSRGANV